MLCVGFVIATASLIVLVLSSSGPEGLKGTNRELLAGIAETRTEASSRTMNISASILTLLCLKDIQYL